MAVLTVIVIGLAIEPGYYPRYDSAVQRQYLDHSRYHQLNARQEHTRLLPPASLQPAYPKPAYTKPYYAPAPHYASPAYPQPTLAPVNYPQPAPAYAAPAAAPVFAMQAPSVAPIDDSDMLSRSRFAIGPVIGTTGLGFEGQYKVNNQLVLRGGPNYLKYSAEEEFDDINYDADLEFLNAGVIADWHPFETGWHVSGGVVLGKMEADIDANPTNNVSIGDEEYTPAEVGTINGNIKNNDIAPYVGFGYNNSFTNESNWSFRANLGVIYSGSPEVSLSNNGLLAAEPEFIAELREEEREIEDDIKFFKFYPIATVGFTYQF